MESNITWTCIRELQSIRSMQTFPDFARKPQNGATLIRSLCRKLSSNIPGHTNVSLTIATSANEIAEQVLNSNFAFRFAKQGESERK